MGYNAGIQLHGTRKPLVPLQNVQKKPFRMKDRLKKLLDKKDFLDKKTIEYLERHGFINN